MVRLSPASLLVFMLRAIMNLAAVAADCSSTIPGKTEVEVNMLLDGELQQRVVHPTMHPIIIPDMIGERLDLTGHPAIPPFPTGTIPKARSSDLPSPEPIPVGPDASEPILVLASERAPFTKGFIADLFSEPISTQPPLAIYYRNSTHPLAKLTSDSHAIPTNKFITNMMVGTRTHTVFAAPYQLRWNKAHTPSELWGMTVSHTSPKQRFYGPEKDVVPVQYYVNPSNLEDIVVGVSQWGKNNADFELVDTTDMSGVAVLRGDKGRGKGGKGGEVRFPLCQGMGMVTALYEGQRPAVYTAQGFVTLSSKEIRPGVTRHKIELNDGEIWLVYMTATSNPSHSAVNKSAKMSKLFLVDQKSLHSHDQFHGILQIAKFPDGYSSAIERIYDESAGVFCTGVSVDGSVDGGSARATYSLSFSKGGDPARPLLMFALPHHQRRLRAGAQKTRLVLDSPTKGKMVAYLGDSWLFGLPSVPAAIDFAPIRRDGRLPMFTPRQLTIIRNAVIADLAQDYEVQSDVESWYFGGKVLTKLAQICWVTRDVLADQELEEKCVGTLKKAFSRWETNTPRRKLAYDLVWKGLISTHGYEDPGQDFGNSAYNDHHFHYGYHVYAAAMLAYLDPAWLTSARQEYVEGLVRDFANPSGKDPYFTPNRSFDWYHGHSWAKGVFESADGKDQESASEDYFCSYAMKLYATVTGNQKMWARATLQLGLLVDSNEMYFQIAPESAHEIHDPKFRANMVTGILFEGKVDYTTYFGRNKEFIHGIQMLPLSPVSPLMRSEEFCKAEYEKFFKDIIDSTYEGWQGILRANQALYDPEDSYKWLSSEPFDRMWIDNGASRSYYLTLVTAWMGRGAAP